MTDKLDTPVKALSIMYTRELHTKKFQFPDIHRQFLLKHFWKIVIWSLHKTVLHFFERLVNRDSQGGNETDFSLMPVW